LSRFRKRLLLIGLFGLITAVAIIIAFGQLATRPTPSAVPKLADNEQEFQLQAKDDVRVAASFFPVPKQNAPVILLLHGNGASRGQFQNHVAWLNAAGFSAMAIDLRGHGESTGGKKSFGLFEARDAEAAVRWIRANHPDSKIGVIGVSLGGASSLLGDKGPLAVDAMILQAVYPDIDRAIYNRIASRIGGGLATMGAPTLTLQSPILYGVSSTQISPVNAAAQYKGPVLVIGGANDVYTPPAETEELHKAFSGEASIWIAPGLGHEQMSDANDAEYQKRVLGFFRKHL
jgi:uncharacterized protein